MLQSNILEDLADRYDNDFNLDGPIKTISYPINVNSSSNGNLDVSNQRRSPIMLKMKERIKVNKETFDKTFSKANGEFLLVFSSKICEFTNVFWRLISIN